MMPIKMKEEMPARPIGNTVNTISFDKVPASQTRINFKHYTMRAAVSEAECYLIHQSTGFKTQCLHLCIIKLVFGQKCFTFAHFKSSLTTWPGAVRPDSVTPSRYASLVSSQGYTINRLYRNPKVKRSVATKDTSERCRRNPKKKINSWSFHNSSSIFR